MNRNEANGESAELRDEAVSRGAVRTLVRRIRRQTDRLNRNNVTRTTAYLDFYEDHPEVHWAFLAHMVSRNGGWNMTDLKGEPMSGLLGDERREELFRMLERANSLIFRDAYAQLLLYREGRLAGKNLSGLLPELGVSAFMLPAWNDFLRTGDSAVLTVCLIVNEQHYLESQVVCQRVGAILESPLFRLQELLQVNQVILPYWPADSAGGEPQVTGLTPERFADLGERIGVGKQLYRLLFADGVREGALRFVRQTPHTGSRADYWPSFFTRAGEAAGTVEPGGKRTRYYSPGLEDVWPDRPVALPRPGDWYGAGGVPRRLMELPAPHKPANMAESHRLRFEGVRLAVAAGNVPRGLAALLPGAGPT